jgi:hypothetical protein
LNVVRELGVALLPSETEGEGRRAGKGLVLTRETGARDSRAAHQPGDACGSAF